jgi:hypothetical protein
MDKNIFSNAKIARWQERLSPYNFICQYIEGSANNFADMFSRPFISVKKSNDPETGKVLGQFYKVPDSPVKIYIPSWTLGSVVLPHKIILENEMQIAAQCLLVASDDNIYKSTPFSEFSDIAIQQRDDKNLKKIFNFIENKVPYEKWKLDPNDQTEKFLSRIKKNIKVHDVTNTLILFKNNTEQIILPRSTVSHYLHICHDDMGHSGVDRIQYLLRHCTWTGKFDNIQNYVSSCSTCLQRKGSYMQKSKIQLKNLNHGSMPFEYKTVDFVHMPQSKTGKKYILRG